MQCIGYQGNTSPGELVGKDIAFQACFAASTNEFYI
jgi:hypothetical protein